MEITTQLLRDINTMLQANWRTGLDLAAPVHPKFAMTINSNTASNLYPDFSEWPAFREWLGEREFKEFKASAYQVFNKTWESSVFAKREHIEDDNLGMVSYQAQALGAAAPAHTDEVIGALLKDGRTAVCHDELPFFSTDHKGKGTAKQSNILKGAAGAGIKFIGLDTSKVLKPAILQMRRNYALTAKMDLSQDVVFYQNRFEWGADARFNAGFGPYFTAFASEVALDGESFAEMRAKQGAFKTSEGRPLNIRTNLILVGASSEAAARKLLKNEYAANGASNEWVGAAEFLVVPWLD